MMGDRNWLLRTVVELGGIAILLGAVWYLQTGRGTMLVFGIAIFVAGLCGSVYRFAPWR